MARPAYQPTDRDRKTVEMMVAAGIEQDNIAKCIGIDPKTMRKHFRAEIDTAALRANAQVGQSLFQAATNAVSYATDDAGRRYVSEIRGSGVTAAIWWTKTRMGWKETITNEQTGKDGGAIQVAFLNSDRNP